MLTVHRQNIDGNGRIVICNGANEIFLFFKLHYNYIRKGKMYMPGFVSGASYSGLEIGAGSVVNRSIPANCVAVSNPCRVIHSSDKGNGEP